MYAVADFKDYETERSLTAELSDATNVITSVVRSTPFDPPGHMHNVVLDLDLPATLLPSSTPGHVLEALIEEIRRLRLRPAAEVTS
jgi:hypothetical protein